MLSRFFKIFSCLVLTFFLGACSLLFRQDGPPMDVDVSGIHDAVPTVGAVSRSTNPSSYVVRGRRYYVLSSSKDYKATGVASWYGEKFYRHTTSSGEPYDVYKMTAASKTLPIPTYIKVTNLSNERHVIVKVNDRGPFMKDRIVDLSYVAAKKLDMIKNGTALVSVEAIDPVSFNKNKVKGVESRVVAHHKKPMIYLQIGAYSDPDNARRSIKAVQRITNIPVHTYSKQVGAHQALYQVQVGPISNVGISDEIVSKMRQKGISNPSVMVK